MRALSHQRCFHHGEREAVACCPACGRFFCRECVTEHDERLLCASCLKASSRRSSTEGRAVRNLLYTLQVAAGLAVTWLFFYGVGQALVRIPSSFHEGTVWKGTWLENP
jgi:hypothetical protein